MHKKLSWILEGMGFFPLKNIIRGKICIKSIEYISFLKESPTFIKLNQFFEIIWIQDLKSLAILQISSMKKITPARPD